MSDDPMTYVTLTPVTELGDGVSKRCPLRVEGVMQATAYGEWQREDLPKGRSMSFVKVLGYRVEWNGKSAMRPLETPHDIGRGDALSFSYSLQPAFDGEEGL